MSIQKNIITGQLRRHNYIKDNNLLGKVLNEIEEKEISEFACSGASVTLSLQI